MANLINTAVSGLKLSELALSVTGQNIVNANTEGYSRQSVTAEAGPTLFNGVGYVGSGVNVSQIERNTQQFLINQYTNDLSILGEFNQYLGNIDQVDNLLADPATSIAAGLDDYFNALNGAANNPSGLENRQLLLTQTDLLLERFKSTESQLLSQNESLNSQLDTYGRSITTIAEQIAELNAAISGSPGISTGNLPNDLLDKRDALVAGLAEIVDVKTSLQSNLSMNVFIGEGQGLVIGPEPAVLSAVPGSQDPSRLELAFLINNEPQVVSRQLSGGKIGGVLRFREEALDPAINALGRIALSLADSMNRQQFLGVDLEGNLGKKVFSDINDNVISSNRIRVDSGNALPADRVLSVRIDDLSQLSTSDYRVSFPGPGQRYSIIKLSDNSLVQQGILSSKLPDEVSVDGFTIEFESGSFQEGDSFLVQPTRTAISNLSVQISRAEEFALASPLISDASIANQGGAYISSLIVNDVNTDSFQQNPGSLSPPIMIRFTSPSTYDVLDVSDPAYPVPLQPPLNNRQFVPGANNAVFPDDPDGTTITSRLGNSANIQLDSNRNGNVSENLTITRVDSQTGFSEEISLNLDSDLPASSIASRLSAIEGVFASASSQVQLSNFASDAVGETIGVSLNGVDLLSDQLVADREVPDPITADFLRDSINNSPALSSYGISALSDGESLTVRSSTGVDLNVEVTGTGGDSLQLRGGDLRSLTGTENLNSGFEVPVNSNLVVDLGFGNSTIVLTPGSYSINDIENTIQEDINRALGSDVLKAEVSSNGRLILSPVSSSLKANIVSVSDPDVFGLSPVTLSGPDIGEQPAVLSSLVSTVDPFDFTATNGSFEITVSGIYNDTITLAASYPAGGGLSIVEAINTQIAASAGPTGLAGLVTARLSEGGTIEFVSTELGPDVTLSTSNIVDMQDLVSANIATGSQLSGTQASLTGNIDISEGFDFDIDGPHQFTLAVDGAPGVAVSLTGTTRVPAQFLGTVDVSSGVNLIATPNTFELSVAGYPNAVIDVSGVDTSLAATAFDSAPQGIAHLFQERIDAEIGAGVIEVGIDSGGGLYLTTVEEGAGTSITVSNPTGDVATSIFPVVGAFVGSEQGAAGVISIVQSAINSSLLGTDSSPVTVGISDNGYLEFTSSTYGANSQISISSVSGTGGYVFAGLSEGEKFTNSATIGGTVDLQLAGGVTLISDKQNGMFGAQPDAVNNYTGYQVYLNSGQSGDGLPQAGDHFMINYNNDGSNDNSNALAMLEISNRKSLSNGNLGLSSAYAQIVEEVGILTNQSRTSQEASESLVRQSEGALQSIAGVNIDEEAANLIKFEQHYNASAQLISIARDLFDAILQL